MRLHEDHLIKLVQGRCGMANVTLESEFVQIGLDSTAVIDLLIELEVIMDIDVLDNRLQLDDMVTLRNVYQYVHSLIPDEEKAE